MQFTDAGSQFVGLGVELQSGVFRQAAQLHVEDVVGLHLIEVEGRHQTAAGLGGVLA